MSVPKPELGNELKLERYQAGAWDRVEAGASKLELGNELKRCFLPDKRQHTRVQEEATPTYWFNRLASPSPCFMTRMMLPLIILWMSASR